MDETLKSFHFQELGWLVSFPNSGNQRKKYADYFVLFAENKGDAKVCLVLSSVINDPRFEGSLPLTVGFFKELPGNEKDCGNAYLEIRIIRAVEDFWKFLNDLDL